MIVFFCSQKNTLCRSGIFESLRETVLSNFPEGGPSLTVLKCEGD